MTELTYDQVAARLKVSPRQVRRVLKAHTDTCPPIIYGHKTVRFAAFRVERLKKKIRREAVQRGAKRGQNQLEAIAL